MTQVHLPRVRSMSSTHITRWLDAGHEPAARWRDFGVSMTMTAALFAAALAAMTSLRIMGVSPTMSSVERVTLVPITFPPPAPVPRPPPTRRVEAPRTIPRTLPPATNSVPAAVDVASPTVAAIPHAPALSSPPRVDSTAKPVPANASRIPLSIVPPTPVPYNPRTTGLGAPIATAGVTMMHAPMTGQVRDSTLAAFMAEVPARAAALPGKTDNGRVRAITIPRHDGSNSPSICICVNLPLPIFEAGPSAAQRKRDAIIAADNLERLRRMQDRALQKRDSIRLDSLRRDSVARSATRPPTPQS